MPSPSKRMVLAALCLVLIFAFTTANPSTAFAGSAGHASNCGLTVYHENYKDDAIQLALNQAAKGKISPPTVCVSPGNYPEQLNITTVGGISLIGMGLGNNLPIIDPSTVYANTQTYGGFGQGAIIVAGINGSAPPLTDINVKNLIIDGARASSSPILTTCNDDYEGIEYYGASGTISNNLVENIYLPLAEAGCDLGGAIQVHSTYPVAPVTVTVADNVLPNYGAGGILCAFVGVSCNITGNYLSYYTAYSPYTTSFGIAVILGASAMVTGNSVSNDLCTEPSVCGPNPITQSQSAGILTYDSATGTLVGGNRLTNNDIGVEDFVDNVTALNNQVTDSTAAAILLADGVGTYVDGGNALSNSPVGVFVINFGDGTTFTSKLGFSNLFSGEPIHVEIETFSPGGATVDFRGKVYSLSGNMILTLT